jgi:hypothetical protein
LPAQPPPGLVPGGVSARDGSVPVVMVAPPPAGSVAATVTAALREAGMAGSWMAAAALDLAATIDGSPRMSGSARAAVHPGVAGGRGGVMGDALRGTDAAGSKVGRYRDELAARRAARAGGDG